MRRHKKHSGDNEDVRIHSQPKDGPPRRDLRRLRPDDEDIDDDVDMVNSSASLIGSHTFTDLSSMASEVSDKHVVVKSSYPLEVDKSTVAMECISALRRAGISDVDIVQPLVDMGYNEDMVIDLL